jgi:hypothetical protein
VTAYFEKVRKVDLYYPLGHSADQGLEILSEVDIGVVV